jgi:hypothetical protein
VLDLVAVAGVETLSARKKCSPVVGKIRVCNAAYGRNGWLGLAQIWLSSGHIVQGVTKMNDTYFALSKYNTPTWRNHVMCQEVGHTLGLICAHLDSSTTVAASGSEGRANQGHGEITRFVADCDVLAWGGSDGVGGRTTHLFTLLTRKKEESREAAHFGEETGDK